MRLEHTGAERDVLARARAFAAAHLPLAEMLAADREGTFPWDSWQKLRDDGWTRLFAPKPWGEGAPLGVLVSALEGLSYGDIATTSAAQRSACFGGHLISQYGGEHLRDRLMPGIASGATLVSFSVTEPEAGSDVANLSCRAVPDGDTYRLTGEKLYVGGAQVADLIIIAARVPDAARGPDAGPRQAGVTLFALPADAPNLVIEPMNPLGHRSVGIARLVLDDVPVDRDTVIGGVGGGWAALQAAISRERLQVAAICLGGSQRCLDIAVEHANRRRQFGKPLIQHQSVGTLLANMAMDLEAARSVLYRTVADAERDGEDVARSAMAKVIASEAFYRIADNALQVTGGVGYLMDAYPQYALREARLYRIGGGTSEILRTVIAKSLRTPVAAGD